MQSQRALCVLALFLALPCWAAAPNGLVVLLTDFGADSVYVGALKGAMYTKFPEARIDAISNSVPPFDVVAGAHMLAEAANEFPPGTTFCCVVDPGVGTNRKRIVVETKTGHCFVGPDNGLLSLVAQRYGLAELREIANRKLFREGEVSQTFHGRDVFGPVAAALARGVALAEVGPELKNLVRLDAPEARVEDGTIHGTVTRSDVYGNLITNVTREDLEAVGVGLNDVAQVSVGAAEFAAPLKSAYGDVPEGVKLLIVQSTGLVECAVNMGSLTEAIKEGPGAAVDIRKQ